MNALRGALNFAHDRGLIRSKKYRELYGVLKTSDLEPKERTPLNTAQRVAILNVAKHDKSPQGMRGQAIIVLLLSGEWSPSEIAVMEMSDLPLAHRHAGPLLDR